LLAVPPLLGLPSVAAAVWAVLGGAALVLSASLPRSGHLGWVPATTGTLTVITGVCWSLPTVHGTVAAVLLVATTAFVVVLLRARTGVGRPDGPARPLYVAGAALWVLALFVGGALLAWSRATGTMTEPLGWLLAALVLTSAATALLFGRLPNPFAGPGRDDSVLPSLVTVTGLLLLPVAPLLTGPENSPVLPDPSRPRPPWSAPVSALLEPAHTVLGLPAQESAAAAAGTALGVIATGALVVGVARLVDRRWTAAALALAAPTALVPPPVILGLPYAVAVAWTALLGAVLTLGTSRIAGGSGWVPGITGTLTLLLGLLWALPERHATLFVVVMVAAAALANALTLPRASSPNRRDRAPRVLWTALSLGALAAVVGAVCLTAVVAVGAGPAPRWLLAAAALLVGAAMMVVGHRPPPATAQGSLHARAARPQPTPATFSLIGLAALTVVPLLAGPHGAPVLAGFARVPFLTSVSPEALLRPAYEVLGLPAQPDTGTALAVAFGLVLSGALAVGAVLLLARRWTTHAVALVTPSALAPVPVVLGAPFAVALVWTLAVGAALTAGSALSRDRRVAWVPGASGLFTLLLGLAWSLPERYALTAALMAVAVVWAIAAALARTTVVAVAATSAATTATGAFALALPLALGAPVEYAALAPIALAAAVAAVAPRLRSPLLEAAEVPAALWAVLAVIVTSAAGVRGEVIGLALAVVGVIALASAVRPRRRWLAVVGGALMLAALWTVLGAWRVTAPEAYTIVPAVAALVVGWEWSRRAVPPPSSWAAYGGGLALLLLPSVVMLLADSGMLWRVPAVLAVGLAVAVWGLRARLRAALALGSAALLLSSLRAFGPPLWDLTVLLPNWVPFAVVGAVLLVVGARYEANLARLRRLGALVSGMR
uniref:SCO7613 C-terminal domain-containing membrane protein n=1 Tax=Nocardiopsis lucentensis TaxID=53441 RepID=UPI00035E9BF1